MSVVFGYYICECGEQYTSDFPYQKCCCLKCGTDVLVNNVTTEELNDVLYNLDILADGCTLMLSQIAEFLHYHSYQYERLRIIMKYLQDKEYISYSTSAHDRVKDLKVHRVRMEDAT